MIKTAIILAVLTLFSCGKNSGNTENKKHVDEKPKKTGTEENIPWKTGTGEDIEYTIIQPGKYLQHIFGDTYNEAELANEEIEYAFKKIDTCFFDQRRGTVNRLLDMKPADYKMQFVCAVNSKGEKMLWVNAFCKSPNNDIYTNWKENLVEVDDGGKCYWNLRLNLDKRGEHYVLRVNGHS